MTVPALLVEQYQYNDTSLGGVLLNGDAPVPFFDVTSIQGLDGTPAVSGTINATGRDGGFVDAANEDIRTVTVEGTAYASVTALETYLNSLKANFAPRSSDAPFYFRTDDTATVKMVMGKSLGFNYTKDSQRRLGVIDAQFSISCADPRIYSSTVQSFTLTVGTNNSMVLVGNRDTPPTFVLHGPLTAPITITYGGTVITYSVTIAAGSNIIIDTLNRTVMNASGTASFRQNVTLSPVGSWPMFQPGSNNVALAAAGGTGTVDVSAKAAWR